MPTWKRAIEILAIAAASLAVLYLLGGNLFLAFGLPRIVGKPSLNLGYLAAWTVWPGRVHVQDFHIQGQSDTVEWKLAAEDGTVDVDLWALTHREVHLHDVHADGLRFRLRLRVMPREADDPKVRALPPIPPYDDPPIRVAGATDPEILRGAYRHWVTRIDDSDALVTEIWVGPYRFEGRARSVGGFYVAAHRAVAMSPPATLDVADGALTLGGREMAHDVEGHVTCAIDSFNPDELHERGMLRAFSGDVKLFAEVPSLAFLDFWVPPARARFEGGGGPFHVDAGLRSGRLTPGSVLRLQNDRLHLRVPGFEIRADGTLDVRTGDDERTVVHARVAEASVWRLGVLVPPVAVTDATADYTTRDGDLAEGLDFAALAVKVPRAEADIRWITTVRAEEPVRFDAGRVTVAGDFDVDAAFNATSHAQGTIHGIALRMKEARLRGELVATASMHGVDVLHGRRFSVDGGTATLSPAVVSRDGDDTRLVARADLEGGELDFRHGVALKLASHARVTGTGAILDLVGAPRLAKAAATLFASTEATATATMAFEGGLFSLKIGTGRSGITHVHGEVRAKGKATEAAFVVGAGPFKLGILLEGGHVQVAPEPGAKWLDEHRSRLTPDERPTSAVARGGAGALHQGDAVR